jgi:hypothetical protein
LGQAGRGMVWISGMKRSRRRNMNDWPVMKQQCATCPFGPNGDPRVCAGVIDRSVKLESSQICHHPSLHGKRQTHLCRGARDLQLKLMTAFGIIPEATDEAFNAKWKELKGGSEYDARGTSRARTTETAKPHA